MSHYKSLFFDLDHTLWDYETNAAETLTELYDDYQLEKFLNSGCRHFIEVFFEANDRLWDQYDRGLIHKSVIRLDRFNQIFKEFGVVNEGLAHNINEAFVKNCPHKTNTVPGAIDLLEELKPNWSVHIITNGFKEVQWIKLNKSGLSKYVDQVFISEELGVKKPDPVFFSKALRATKSQIRESLVIGDNLNTDIKGARESGIDHVYYNPKRKNHTAEVTHEVDHLSKIRDLV